METCRGRRDRPSFLGIDGLITLTIVRYVVAFDVRWKGDVANRIDGRLDRRAVVGPQSDRPPAMKAAFENLAVQHMPAAAKDDPRIRAASFWPGCTSASQSVVLKRREEKALDCAAGRDARTEQPGGKHLGIVDHEQIALAEELGQSGHDCVLNRALVLIEDEQPRAATL